MEPADFFFIVLPLGVIVFTLASAVFYYGQREERQSAELRSLRMQLRSGEIDNKTYKKRRKRLDQEKLFNEELDRLQALHESKSIDQETYTRLSKLIKRAQMLEAGYEHVATDTTGRMYFEKPSGSSSET